MRESSENIWKYFRKPDHFVCITTNGFVKKNGAAVMGRGCALEATRQVEGIERILGNRIKEVGNVPGFLLENLPLIIFPVKHNWWEPASIELIKMSTAWLKEYAENNGIVSQFHLPRPGCGNGRLRWEDVKPLLECLPDNVAIHYKEY